ncbi:unnamed protein product [Pseudo-nitzschia multistriata]|uniref:Uncharacterized protein n=1 Tax=Pseudo-nitzschia multistriata TaxID=183589 RepID=A0A448Z4C3_9STRA|nr:unnamed protein product [Pseudo-nitzschia multistriata]
MSAWGKNGSARSCDDLLKRVEENDPRLTEITVLPLKKFGSREIFRLVKCLDSEKNTHLRSLQASGHGIDDHTALEALGRALGMPLESIAVGDSNMGDGGVCALCRGIECNKKIEDGQNTGGLKAIDLSFKNVGKEGLRAIIRVLGALQSLDSIDLSRNENIGPSFDFLEFVSTKQPIFPGLVDLDLSGCRLDTSSCTTLLQAMQPIEDEDGQEKQTSERTSRNLVLKLNSNNFSDPLQVKDMMNVLSQGSLVSQLYISACQIGDDGMEHMINECCKSGVNNDATNFQSLHTLDVSNNDLSSIASLANRLHQSANGNSHYFSNLKSLNLSNNPLGANLLSSIGSNVQWISSLEELDLSNTTCEIPGAVELICRSNSQSASLKKLNLFGNKLGSDGFLELAKVLRGGHASLEYLDLGGNGATESGVVELVKAVTSLSLTESEEKEELPSGESTLRVLVVGGNSGGQALEKVINEAGTTHPDLDIARDKAKKKQGVPNGGNMMNNTPGTSWTS